jgi:hypothetical protein
LDKLSPTMFILRDSGFIAMEQPDVATAWPAPPKYYLEARRRPPPPPPDGPISMYGIARAPLGETPPAAPLEKQLYELGSDDPCGELRKLNHTLLSTFLALLQTAQDTPSQCHVRVDEMRHLMLNMQHLINTFRPYQAREELISVAQAQVDAKRALLEPAKSWSNWARRLENKKHAIFVPSGAAKREASALRFEKIRGCTSVAEYERA